MSPENRAAITFDMLLTAIVKAEMSVPLAGFSDSKGAERDALAKFLRGCIEEHGSDPQQDAGDRLVIDVLERVLAHIEGKPSMRDQFNDFARRVDHGCMGHPCPVCDGKDI